MSYQAVVGIALLFLAGLDFALAVLGISRYPALFRQHGSHPFVVELVSALLLYAGAAAMLLRQRNPMWRTVSYYAAIFGCITGSLEVLSIATETWFPAWERSGLLSVGVMVTLFLLWGIAASLAAHRTGSIKSGLWTAVTTAALCMLVAVAAGFVVEFFLVTPDVAAIQTWQEFKRSGWSDAKAFGVANTLDSGFTHLLIAPLVAFLFGLGGSFIGRSNTRHGQMPA